MNVLDLTPHELAEMTVRDLQARKEKKLQGIKAADQFIYETACDRKKQALRSNKRGIRSCK